MGREVLLRKTRTDMNKIEFNTQIATTIEQSKRLLELGLKPETSDMHHYKWSEGYWEIQSCPPRGSNSRFIPAWSLHRLITILPLKIEDDYSTESFLKIEGSNIVYKVKDIFIYNSFEKNNIYDNIIDCIEWLIKDYYFNKDYLK